MRMIRIALSQIDSNLLGSLFANGARVVPIENLIFHPVSRPLFRRDVLNTNQIPSIQQRILAMLIMYEMESIIKFVIE